MGRMLSCVLRIHARGGGGGNFNRCVVALGAPARIRLPQYAWTVFVTEPLTYGLCTESPEVRPMRDRIMALLVGLGHCNKTPRPLCSLRKSQSSSSPARLICEM